MKHKSAVSALAASMAVAGLGMVLTNAPAAAAPSSRANENATYYANRPTPNPSDPLDKDRQTRFAFGLRRDDSYMREIRSRASAHESGVVPDAYGIAMTEAEERELHAREVAANEDRATIRSYFSNRGDVFGGLYLDHPAGGRVTALVTSGASEHESVLRALVAHPDRLSVVEVANSLNALARVTDRVHELRADASANDVIVVSVGHPVPNNVVVIEVSSNRHSAEQYFGERLAAGTFSVRVVKGPAAPVGNNGTAGPPWRGAHGIGYSTSQECTSGLTLYRDPPKVASRTYYLATAAHCFLNGQSIRQPSGTNTIGSTGQRCFSTGCTADAILINMTQTQARTEVIKTPGGNNFTIRFEQGQGVDLYGDAACVSVGGIEVVRNNWYCGTLVDTSFDSNATDPFDSNNKVWFYFGREATGLSAYHGDSGAPWFNGLYSWGNLSTALGITHAQAALNPSRPVYHHIYDVRVSTNTDGVYRTG